MKNLMLENGEIILNFLVIVAMVVLSIASLALGGWAIILIPVIILAVIAFAFPLYLLIDIRDSLKKLVKNDTQKESPVQISQEEMIKLLK